MAPSEIRKIRGTALDFMTSRPKPTTGHVEVICGVDVTLDKTGFKPKYNYQHKF